MDAPEFAVTYRLVLADYTAMMESRYRVNPAARASVTAIKAFVAVAGLFALCIGGYARDPFGLLVAAVLLSAPLIAPRINAWAYGRAFTRQRLDAGDVHVLADQQSIRFNGPTGDTRFPWSQIGEIDETAAHVILWVHAYQAIPIPVRAFASPAEAGRFAAFAKTHASGPAMG